MALTLIEAAKIALNNGEVKRAAVISMFARSSAWLAALPFREIPGGAFRYDREGSLPGIAFRGINESYTGSTGIINPQTEALRVAGGDLDVDVAIVKMYGAGVRATHESMKVKALSAEMTRVLIKGDSEDQPREFDGLQVRVTGTQLTENLATDGGDPLGLFRLDTMISTVAGPNKHLWMNKTMQLRLSQAARTTGVGGYITYDINMFGQQVMSYNGIPIDVPYPENDGTEPLAFDEVGATGVTATATSIYCVSLADGYVQGIQNGGIEVRDLGEINESPVYRTRVEWLPGLVIENPRGVGRLRGITNAVVTA